ncbi:TonB-dependent receptor [Dyadobacter sp. LHD-138]|uniref:TonB-dependent receptor n=1 Tax=Dyadobacter sp. LHD-138 TaxID=3071413 RepID=UPI0027E0BCD8|nr:TonB-dependent receptor [Dyadobacter sp. LHD-138]MDQ6481840.1 TonB-dependent receptor [Dyadobacter sp. LHD-138]
MKEFYVRLFFWVLLVHLCAGSKNAAAQSADSQIKATSLGEALRKVSHVYSIKFAYDHNLVSGVNVRYDFSKIKGKPLDEVLNSLLIPVGLKFKAASKSYYIITKSDEGKSVSSGKEQQIPEPKKVNISIVVKGRVTDKKTKKPVEFATVSIAEIGAYVLTDDQGNYSFRNVPQGRMTVKAQSLTTVTSEKEVDINPRQTEYQHDFEMDENILSLREVKVVASESKAGSATSSTISRTAIEHLQATSLADVLQLLPGALALNPDLTSVNKASLRQISADNVGSLGTAVMINGAPLSNNANLQVSNTSTGGANAGFATTTGAGIDLRQVSADNIESIEVIRGIPSAEYGDLTSGAILVKTKAGKEPFQVKARVNPTLTQVWLGKGFGFGEKYGSLNVDLDYTYSVADQRLNFTGYNRITGSLLYTKKFFRDKPLVTTTGFAYAMNVDEQKQDPDDSRYPIKRKAQDYAFRFNTSGRWNLQKPFLGTLNYLLSANYSIQKGFNQEQVSSYIYPLSYAMKDTMLAGQFVPSNYVSKLWIEGKPLNIFAKITNSFYTKTGMFSHKVLMGAEWKTDVNSGAGKMYDLARPPRMMNGNGARPRPYSDIPALNQLSMYLEDNIRTEIVGRTLGMNIGLRYDNVQPEGFVKSGFGNILSPRINLSYELKPGLALRAGYGITAKAPTLLYLYPQNAYYDLLNFNFYPENPSERLVLISTRVFNTENPNLKMAKNTKKEIGFDWAFVPGKRLTVTAYYEQTKNGYGFSNTAASTQVMEVDKYEVESRPEGEKPVLKPEPVRTELWTANYLMPDNSRRNVNRGIEFDLNLGRFDFLRTSFVLNGAWMSSRSTANNPLLIKQVSATGAEPSKIALYPVGDGSEKTRFNTTLRVIHNIPELRFVVTMAIQTIWIDSHKYVGQDTRPVGYMDVTKGGETVWLTEEERNAITESNVELYRYLAPQYYLKESWKPLWLVNLKLTKEIGRNIGFSFFANNVFLNRPLEESTRWKGEFTRRNQGLFFGTELYLKF